MNERGREFMLGFPSPPNASLSGLIILHMRGPKDTAVVIDNAGPVGSNHYTIDDTLTLTIDLQYTAISTPAHDTGVSITSSDDISLYVIRGDNDGYLAIPKSRWSTSFYLVSYPPTGGGYSYFSIIGYEDTNVEITPRMELNCGSIFLSPSILMSVRILAKQKYDMYCSGDVTGTFIRSQKPISVVAGVTFLGDSGWERVIEEMMLPKAFFGRNFVLPAVSEDAAVLRVVASENNTEIYDGGNLYTYLDAGDYIDVETLKVFCLKASRPIQVVMLGRRADSSYFSVNDHLGDPIMAIVPAVERFQHYNTIDIFPVPGDGLVMFFVERGQDITSLPAAIHSYFEYSDCCNIGIHYLFLPLPVVDLHLDYPIGLMQMDASWNKGFGLMMGSSLDPPNCPRHDGFVYLNNSGLCIKVFTTLKSWTDARTFCRENRLHLVLLDTQDKINSINAHLEDQLNTTSFSIGLHLEPENNGISYNWIDGGTLGNTNWLPSQPDGYGLCVQLAKDKEMGIGWQNVNCGVKSGYVCEAVLSETQNVQLFTGQCQYSHPGCPTADGYTYIYEAELCVKHHPQPETWINAAAACRADGDRLVTVDSDSKQHYLHEVYRHISSKHYIGASWHNAGQWVWMDCMPLVYANWAVSGNQSVIKGEHCAVATVDGYWDAVVCDEAMSFICEKPLTTMGPDDGTCEEISSTSLSFAASLISDTNSVDSDTVVLSSEDDTMMPVLSSQVILSSLNPNSIEPLLSVSSTDSITDITETASSSEGELMSVWSSNGIMSSQSSTDTWSSTGVSAIPRESSIHGIGYNTMPSQSSYVINSSNARSSATISTSPLASVDVNIVSGTISLSSSEDILTDIHWGVSESVGAHTSDPTQTHTDVSSGFRQTSTHSITALVPDSNPGRVVYRVCRCSCIPENRLNDLSIQSVDEKKKEIRENLLLDKTNLTKTIRKYISAPDERKSSSSIGATGVTLIVFTSLLILFSDVIAFFQSRHQKYR
ncbi:uncharacterized protein LOC125376198 [Haliotis rufescens]|uniref:uncharacterized protein LOC125376198 n=1 Tax=Haliotis rufescens TaxID=6454 RepID=UPI00201F6EBE|nr:uncharacterized protein LOC125376198 [Haliotis rufescens]